MNGDQRRCRERGKAMRIPFRSPGGEDSFQRETRPFFDALCRTALRLAGQHADAEDLVHGAYVKAYRAQLEFILEQEDGAWRERQEP
jgi:DNA-directed RNA polymerase specialized sigma24 family protein